MGRFRLISLLSLFVALAPAAATDESAASYSDPAYGFSVEVPELGSATVPMVQRAMFAGPAVGGFAVNCNVQIQFVEMPFSVYLELTKQQFTSAGVEVASITEREVSALPGAVFEYAGAMNGRELRYLAIAVGGADRVWLVTCTAPAGSFEQHRAAFVQVIESLEVSTP
jgi:hypothetical protein